MNFRAVRADDVPSILEITKTVFKEYGMTIDLDGQDAFDRDLTRPHEHYAAPDATFIVATESAQEDARVLGMVGAHLEYTDARTVDHAVLHRLYISPAARGRGLGKAFCNAMEDWALDKATVCNRRSSAVVANIQMRLWSDMRLPQAHRMYQSMGYQITGCRELTDPDRCIEFEMRRSLSIAQAPAEKTLSPALQSALRTVNHAELASDAALLRRAHYAANAILDSRMLAASGAPFPVLPPLTTLFDGSKIEEISALVAANTVIGLEHRGQRRLHPSISL